MGSTHAGFILMTINRAVVGRVRDIWYWHRKIVILNDAAQLFQGVVLDGDIIAVYIHIDDFGAISISQEDSDEAIALIADELRAIGFRVKTKTGTIPEKCERLLHVLII